MQAGEVQLATVEEQPVVSELTAPGRITFVTFNGNKVIKVKESYAGLGAEAAAPLPPQ